MNQKIGEGGNFYNFSKGKRDELPSRINLKNIRLMKMFMTMRSV